MSQGCSDRQVVCERGYCDLPYLLYSGRLQDKNHPLILLPGSLPTDRATLSALCEGMGAHTTLAKTLMHASVEPCDGSWSDYERLAAGIQGDLTDGQQLATRTGVSTHDKYFAIATPLHAALGLSDLTPVEPESVGLSEDASRALCDAAHTHLAQDNIAFQFVNATTWLIELPVQLDVITERPDWIIGEALRQNFPRGSDADRKSVV